MQTFHIIYEWTLQPVHPLYLRTAFVRLVNGTSLWDFFTLNSDALIGAAEALLT